MNTINKLNSKFKLHFMLALTFMMCVTSIVTNVHVSAYATGPATGANTEYDMSGLESRAISAISDGQAMVVRVAMALVPVSIIVAVVVLLFVHDAKTVKTVVLGCIAVFAAAIVILLVNAGAAHDILSGLLGMEIPE